MRPLVQLLTQLPFSHCRGLNLFNIFASITVHQPGSTISTIACISPDVTDTVAGPLGRDFSTNSTTSFWA